MVKSKHDLYTFSYIFIFWEYESIPEEKGVIGHATNANV